MAATLVLAPAAVGMSLITAGGYDLSWHTVDGGGGEASGGAFRTHMHHRQHDAGGPMGGGTCSLSGGFWAGGGEPTAVFATLTDVTRTLGLYLSGGVAELLASDDTYYVLQSGPGFNPSEPHPARADFGFDTAGAPATTLDVSFEAKANIGGPTSVLLIRNFGTSQWDELDRFGLSPVDQTFTFAGIPAGDYINGSNRIEVRIRTFAVLVLNPTVRGVFSHDLVGVQMHQ